MKQEFQIKFESSKSGKGFRFSGNPIAFIILLIALFWLILVCFTAVKLLRDYYFPYEGQVVRIETQWTDYVAFELMTWEHLIIETEQGEIIDRLVGFQRRTVNNIKSGDYVVKKRGFRNYVRPRDKKTNTEMLEEWNLRKKRKE